MITLRLMANDCNPAMIGDLVMLNNAILAGLARCDYRPAGGSFMPRTFYAEYDIGEEIGFIQATVSGFNLYIHLTAETVQDALTLADALISVLNLKNHTVNVIDGSER